MNSDESTDLVERDDLPEATVLRIGILKLSEEQVVVVKDAVDRQTGFASDRLILDFSAVEYLSSAGLGWLIKLRKQLMKDGKPFQPPCRRRTLFAFYPDVSAALEAVRQGESDPMLLCGVREEIREIFEVC